MSTDPRINWPIRFQHVLCKSTMIFLFHVAISSGQATNSSKTRTTQTSETKAGLGKIEHPVSISRSVLTSSGSQWDPGTLKDDWYVKAIEADRIPAEEIDLQGWITVAVIDSGIDSSHPAFSNDLWEDRGEYQESRTPTRKIGWDFVNHDDNPIDDSDSSHGTHVAGLASARWMGTWLPAFGPAKLDGHLKLLIMKVAGKDENVISVEPAIDFAVEKGAKIVSASWTLWPDVAADRFMQQAKATLFVVAAGNANSGTEIDEDNPIYPASYKLDNMITVGATDPEDKVAYFSNYGRNAVQVFAPGVEIKSTVRSDSAEAEIYGRLSGTSQATPQVALAAALIWGNLGTLPVKAVKARIVDTSDFVGDTWQKGSGGRLNLAKAITIDHDLLELSDSSHTLLVGTIQDRDIEFVENDKSCSDPNDVQRFNVSDNHVTRVAVHALEGKSVIFVNKKRILGHICNPTIKLVTTGGQTVEEPIDHINDLIWGLWLPHDVSSAREF